MRGGANNRHGAGDEEHRQRDADPAEHEPGRGHALSGLARLADLAAGHVAEHYGRNRREKPEEELAHAAGQGGDGQRVRPLRHSDVLNLLRIQFERQTTRPFPSVREYALLYAMTQECAARSADGSMSCCTATWG